jgi:hypothetical protein
MKHYEHDLETLANLVAESEAVEAAIAESVREALLMHKRLGNPVVSWENGQVVWIPADQIQVDDDGTAE